MAMDPMSVTKFCSINNSTHKFHLNKMQHLFNKIYIQIDYIYSTRLGFSWKIHRYISGISVLIIVVYGKVSLHC